MRFVNVFVKEVVLILSKVLGKNILDSSLLACLLVLDMILDLNINFSFFIINLSIN